MEEDRQTVQVAKAIRRETVSLGFVSCEFRA